MSEFNLMGIKSYGDLLRALQRGARLCAVETYRDGTQHLNEVVWADDRYIRWHHYGSSANKATARDMEFVVTGIFKTDLDGFVRQFVWA